MSAGSLLKRGADGLRGRLASPVPPCEPEPHQDDAWALGCNSGVPGPGNDRVPGRYPAEGGADPVVFGTWRPGPPRGTLTVLCPRCDAGWAQGTGAACWACGEAS